MTRQGSSNGGGNPWGNRPGGPRSPWGGGGQGGGHGGGQPPELDELLRRAQENFRGAFPSGFGGGKILLLVLLAVIVLWLSSGFYIIKPGVHGVIQRFGLFSRTQTEEGLGYRLPWPVETIERVTVSEVRRMEIGFVERVANRAGGQRQGVPEESLMLTSDANIVDLDLVVLWNINSAENFIFNIRDPEATIKRVAESAIREVVGQTPMFSIITQEREQVASRAREIMTAILSEYQSGVNVQQVLILKAEVHPDVQDAFQDVQSARQDAINVQNQAQAYREDILPRARGEAIKLKQEAEAYREAQVAKAVGDTERFNAVYQAYLSGKDVTRERIYIETMEEVLSNAQKIIIDEAGGSGVVPYLPLNEMKPAPRATGRTE